MAHSGGINQQGYAFRDVAMVEAKQADPLDGLLKKGDLEYLPRYSEEDHSQIEPLVVLDCVKAIADSMKKSRLLLFHIARKERSILGFLPRSFKLSGVALEIDRSLAAFLQKDWMHGYFGIATRDDPEGISRLMQDNVTIIAENKSATACLLQLDRKFRDTVVNPLKNNFIYKSNLDYKSIISKVETIENDVHNVLSYLAKTIGIVKAEMKETLRQTKIRHKLLSTFPEEIVDVIYGETKNKANRREESLVFFKLADGRNFTEGQKEEVKKLAQGLLPIDRFFCLAYVDQCFDFPVDEAGNKVGAAVKQIIFGLPEDPSVRVANPESLEWYREWIATAQRGR